MIPALLNRGIGFGVGVRYEPTLGLAIGAAAILTSDIIFTEPARPLLFIEPARPLYFSAVLP